MGTKPKKNFDACDDFFMLVLTAHILSASMNFLGMATIDDDPNPDTIPPEVRELSKKGKKYLTK